jgi:polar amino acid transport system ATP-binding protein
MSIEHVAPLARAGPSTAPHVTDAQPKPLLRLSGIRKSFGSLDVLRGISLELCKGEVLVVIGRSGSGKSTLLRCVNLLEVPRAGTLGFGDWEFTFQAAARPRNDEVRALRRQIGMVFQQFNLWRHLRVERNVSLPLQEVLGLTANEARERARTALEAVGLREKMELYPGQLSGGQQQRVAIARALAMKPRLMMFDEATSALDPELKQDILGEMRRLAENGMTMLVVTHEMGFAREVGDRLVFMDKGVIVEEGPARQVISDPAQPATREFLRSILHATE